MKYISQYLPFFILTILLYSLFFHFHKQSTIIPELAVNSGDQAMQLALVETTNTDSEETSPEDPLETGDEGADEGKMTAKEIIEELKRAAEEKTAKESEAIEEETEVAAEDKTEEPEAAIGETEIATAETPESTAEEQTEVTMEEPEAVAEEKIEVAKEETADKAIPIMEQAVEQQVVELTPEQKIAREKLQKSIQETTAVGDAMLKAELFATEFNLAPSTHAITAESLKLTEAPEPVEIVKTPKIIKKAKVPAAKRKEAISKTAENKIIKRKIPEAKATESKVTKSEAAKEAPAIEVPEKQVALQKPEKKKAVFKKQPTADNSGAETQGVLQEAIVVSGNTPVYPKTAILRNQEGRVEVKLTVTMKGRAKDPQIITSSGHSILDNAILDFVQEELFMPAHRGEEKVTSEQVFTFRFELK